jgi:hypothetical protein
MSSPLLQRSLSRAFSSQHHWKPLIHDHSAWGPRLTHRLNLLCQGLRYLKLLRKHHLRLAVIEKHHSTMHASSSSPAPMAPLHLAANTLTLRTSSSTAYGPSRPPPTLPLAETSLRKRRPQGGSDADGAAVAVQKTGLGFHPETPSFRTWRPIVLSPTGRTTPQWRRHHYHLARVPVKTFARLNTTPFAQS